MRFKTFLLESEFKGFTPDMIRTLAKWCEDLKLTALQKSGFELYHKMTVTHKKDKSKEFLEEVNSKAMNMIKVIRDTEKDKQHFYSVMNAWNIK